MPRRTLPGKRETGRRQPANAILLADVHLRSEPPECRTDDFLAAMDRKLDFIQDLQKRNGGCPVLVAGDVFDRPRPPVWLVTWAMRRISGWVAVPGQHDLPEHSLGLYHLSGLAALEAAGKVQVLLGPSMAAVMYANPDELRHDPDWAVVGFPWGTEPEPRTGPTIFRRKVAVAHRYTYLGSPPFPGAEAVGSTAQALLRKTEGFDLVVTGDNHGTFVHRQEGRLLVNPGSMMRTSAAQMDHVPCVYLWWADDNSVKREILPHDRDAVDRAHLDRVLARDRRVQAFVERLADGFSAGIGFEENLRRLMAAGDVDEETEHLVWEAVEKGGGARG